MKTKLVQKYSLNKTLVNMKIIELLTLVKMSVIILLLNLIFFKKSFTQNDAFSMLKEMYPELMKAEYYGSRLNAQRADYIIAIDVSGTMLNHRNLVVPAIQRFIQSIPTGDFVCFIQFGTEAREYGISGNIDDGTRNSFLQYPEQMYVRDNSLFQYTDLYQMAVKIAEFATRPGANNLKYIFMFTDFIHEPSRITGIQQIEELRQRMQEVYRNNTLKVFAMKLPGVNTGRDIQMIRNIFPNLQAIDVENAERLNEWFERQRAEIYKSRLADMIYGDFEKLIKNNKIFLTGKLTIPGKLKVKAHMTKDVPEFYAGIVFEKGKILEKNNIDKINFYQNVSLKRDESEKSVGECIFSSKYPVSFNNFAKDSVFGKVFFEEAFQKDLEKLGIADKFVVKNEVSSSASFIITWPLWVFILFVLALISLIFLIFYNTLIPKKLKNYVVKIDDGAPITIGNKTKYVISSKKSADYQLNTNENIEIIAFISRADPFNLIFKKDLHIKIHGSNFSVRIDNVLQGKRNSYKIPMHKEVIVSINLFFVKLLFYQTQTD